MFKNLKTKKCWLLLGIILLSAGVTVAFCQADVTETKADAFSSTGGRVSSTNFETVFIVGQSSPTNISESSNFREIGGFLASFGIKAKLSISGSVLYDATGRFVSGSILDLTNSGGNVKDTTDVDGTYLLSGIAMGNVELVPSKMGDQRNAITGADGLMVLQYLAFMRSLTDQQKFAADITGEGNVTGGDALGILRYLAFFTTGIGHTGEWSFVPADTSFDLTENAVVDFKAFLLGDVNLSWGSTALAKAEQFTNALVAFGDAEKGSNQEISIPILIATADQEINTLIFSLDYDSTLLTYQSTALTALTQDFMLVSNGTEPGKLHVAMAGVKGVSKPGAALNLSFSLKAISNQSGTQLQLSRALINDMASKNLASLSLNFEALKVGIPEQFDLSQNYPNPFNPITIIEYQLPRASQVCLRIYNLMGQEIRTLLDEHKEAGYHQVKWDGKDAAGNDVTTGIYLYTIQAGDFQMNRKMIKVK